MLTQVRTRIRLRFTLALVLAASGLVAGSTSASEQTASQPGSSAFEDSMARLDAIALARGAVGVYYDAASAQAVVVVPASGASTFRVADASTIGIAVRVERRQIDPETIGHITTNLVDLRSSVAQWGEYASYFDPQLGKVAIQSEAPRSAFAALESRFVDQVAYVQADVSLLSRTNDPAPHYGGAYVTDGSAGCTTGWTMKNASGWRVMVTAGHCFPNGASAYQNAGSMGSVSRDPTYPGIDVEILYGSTYAARTYSSASGSLPVVGASDPAVGGNGYCYSGWGSGRRCGFQNTSNNATICGSFGCTYNLAILKNGTDGIVPQPGDSGAPYYLPSGSGASIRGMVVASSCSLFGCQGYAQKYTTIANLYVMSIATN